jgi:cytochrome c
MPYLDPGSLTDEEAEQVAAFITSQPRPSYPFKETDYLSASIPVDAVHYEREREERTGATANRPLVGTGTAR